MAYDYYQHRVNDLTSLDQRVRDSLIRWYAKLPEAVRMEVHRLQLDLLRQNRDKQQGYSTEFSYSMLITALKKMKWVEGALAEKAALLPEQAKRISEFRIERAKAKAGQRRKRLAPKQGLLDVKLFHVVKKCRGEGLSWRATAGYLSNHHGLKVSHTYLKCVFEKLQKQRSV